MLPPAEQAAMPPTRNEKSNFTICFLCVESCLSSWLSFGFCLAAPAEEAATPFYTRRKMHLYHTFFFKGIRPFYPNGRLPDDQQGSFLALPKEFVADARQCPLLAAVQHCVWLFVRMSLVRPLQVASSPGALEKIKSLPGD